MIWLLAAGLALLAWFVVRQHEMHVEAHRIARLHDQSLELLVEDGGKMWARIRRLERNE